MSAEEDNRRATETVRTILSDPAIDGINFSEGDTTVSKSTIYQKVMRTIDAGDIAVLVLPNLLPPNYAALFAPTLKVTDKIEFYNVIILRKPDLGTSLGEAFDEAMAIVHECTHAGFSAVLAAHMTHLQHEARAYVAQSIFAVTKMLAMRGDPKKVKYSSPINAAAWEIAMLDKGRKAARSRDEKAYYTSPDFAVTWRLTWNKLYTAIANQAEYAPSANDEVANVPLGRQWKTER